MKRSISIDGFWEGDGGKMFLENHEKAKSKEKAKTKSNQG